MKRFIILQLILLSGLAVTHAQQTDEDIFIEMQGPAVMQTSPAPQLWNYNARQLTVKWRGKTRENLLYTIPVVSDRDGIIRGKTGEYALVEYFNNGQFRKFLFRAETPQQFVAAAATAADVLAINKKYQVNIGLSLADFENVYGKRAKNSTGITLPENTLLYEMAYSDINTPKPQTNWFLFENKKLTKTFYSQADQNAYFKNAPESDKPKAVSPAPAAKKPNKPNTPRKALVWGGTATDQAYMPRVVNPNPALVFSDTRTK